MERKRQVILWTGWAILCPVILAATYHLWPPSFAGNMTDLILFFILMCLVCFKPIIVNDTPIFFVEGVALAVFIYFGVFAEMLMMQISTVLVMLSLRVGLKQHYRYATNSLMFLLVCLLGGVFYESVSGQHGKVEFSLGFLLNVIGYSLVVWSVNHCLLHMARLYLYQRKDRFFTKDFWWEIFSSVMVLPVGIILYLLYAQLGMPAILYVGIPMVTLGVILNLYYSSQRVNGYLQQAAEIGKQLTERLEEDEVLNVFHEKMTAMFPVDYAYIIDIVDHSRFKIIRTLENGAVRESGLESFPIEQGISGYTYRTQKGVLVKKRSGREEFGHSLLPESVESVISVPIIRSQEVTGIVLFTSNKKRAYENYQLMIVELLTAHLGVAIENARSHAHTKEQSIRCSLTKLYNYRYLEKSLQDEFALLRKHPDRILSLVILDIDHFKSINDTYGHQAGNEVLSQLARRLERFTGDRGTVYRYGGEEFVILLPEMEKNACFAFAEGVRNEIASTPFLLEQDMNETKSRAAVPITASIGIAAALEDADDELSLIRHADRAMYVGAKQAGRNKVAGYGR
ncbi:sensor domain-containing diguanylate cyclase [Metabacillus sp. GX 13764]|uniref:sensor domain-containing diguanylate cyclase n=1 Tax=Metabacillus kandeliae TaxID=2900151 RepID=UPI001E64A11A|nr:sensor domain-containing diguanylate cyclase [Metabacillus kandeliae]MCD7032900.1 sensor domain-containing diguanylate cyclase [Metabacillus kandeliae]